MKKLILIVAVLFVLPRIVSGDESNIYDDFIYAVRDCNFKAVNNILHNGFDVNSTDKNGWTALHWVNITYELNEDKFVRMLQLLIDNGATVNAIDSRGRNSLVLMLDPGDDQISPPPVSAINVLIKNGVDVESKDNDGNSVMSIGINSEYKEVRELFLNLREIKAN